MTLKKNSRFVGSALLIAFFSLLSRLLGVLRSSLLAAFYGATGSSGLSDCYTASFKLPDIIFNLVAAGSISIILIPYFSSFISKDDEESLNRACSSFFNLFLLLIVAFTVFAFFFAPYFVRNFLVAGWTNESNIVLTIKMTRILLLQVLFMTMSSIFGSYLNSIERFFSYSVAMLFYNVGIIFGIVFLSPIFSIEGVVWGVVIGAFGHFLIQLIGSIKNGFRYSFVLPSFNREERELFLVAIPRIIAISSEQLVRFFFVNFGSFIFLGSIFIFDNIENIGMLPYGIIAVSVSTAAFPIFVKLFNQDYIGELVDTLLKNIRFLLFLILPATIFMILFRYEIVELLLGYNKFSANDVNITVNGLLYYLFGIPFLSITIVVVKFYYSMKRSILPMIVALISVAVTIAASYLLVDKYNIVALSLGRFFGYSLQAFLLLFFLFSKRDFREMVPKHEVFQIVKIVFVCIVVFFIGLLLYRYANFTANIKLNSILTILIIGGTLSLLYIILSAILRVDDVRYFIGFIKKRIDK